MMTATEELVRQLGLDAHGVATLQHLTATQRKIDRKLVEIETLISERRADVLELTALGVTKYRLAKLLDLSQTTMGNIVRGGDGG